ncbi:MAG: hypothetical protein SFX73_12310 [Kofleriaceae bacterium]|nr:hypothetical protein [Kofleriaceae bacterium]
MRTLATLVLIASSGCAVNEAAGNAAPVPPPAARTWIAPGTRLVERAGMPMYVVDDRYWIWRDGRWLVWRDVGWRSATPPSTLRELDSAPREGWQLGAPAFTTSTSAVPSGPTRR